jgi:hypothetical protein
MRDLWHAMDKTDNSRKRYAILQMLKQSGGTEKLLRLLADTTDQEFNEFFLRKTVHADGSDRNRNLSKYIQSPANWRLSAFDSKLNNYDMVVACKVKWSFRIKPDLVIQTDDNHALCVELKLESGEGFYPSDGKEKQLLRERKLFCEGRKCIFPMSQTDLQKFMMEKLLGLECRFLFLTRYGDKAPTELSWHHLCDVLDHSNLPSYLERAMTHVAERRRPSGSEAR